MAEYQGREVTFAIPQGWNDRSVIAFSPEMKPNKSAPSFTVSRELLKEGQTLRTFAGRQMTELAKALDHFNLRETRDLTVSGNTAIQYEFTWVSPTGPLFQQLTFTQLGNAILLFTGTSPQNDANQVRKVFDETMASVKLRELPPEEQQPSHAHDPSHAPVAGPTNGANGPQSPTAPRADLPADWWPGAKRR
jgi:hypothetical protein